MTPGNSLSALPSSCCALLLSVFVFTASIVAVDTASGPTLLAGSLKGTSWRLVEFQSMDDAIGTVRPEDSSQYTLRLNADGTVGMQLSCNRANGTWSAEPGSHGGSGRFSFGPLATTRALCPPPSMDERISRDAEFVRSYLVRHDTLFLSLLADAGIYTWVQAPVDAAEVRLPASPENGGPRNWVVAEIPQSLNLREHPSTTAKILARFAPGTLLDNLGCRQAQGRIWCDVQQLGGGPRGFVAHEFLKPAVAPDGTVACGPDNSALRAGQGEFDATGTLTCTRSEGQSEGRCHFGVARAGGGYATVVITRADSTTRIVFFRMGIPIGTSTSEADGVPEFSASKEADLHIIRIGNERYEIPDAVVMGG